MNPKRQRTLEAFALPVEQQREALTPLYVDVYEAYGVDWDTNTELFHEDYVFEGRGSIEFPGLPRRIEGRDGYIDGHRQLLDVVDMARVEFEEIIPLGDARVVILTRFIMRAGGGEVAQQAMELHEFRDGLLHRHYYWFHRDEGRRELGL